MQFETDIFVSYAHIDDQSLVEGQPGWISSFHRALEIRLAQLLGKEPRIFRDPKLQGNEVFSDSLIDRLPRTALLVSVLSPRYVRSEWCTRELQEFLRASEGTGGVRVADKVRVFKVVKTPVPLEEHPTELQQVLGYEFFTVEGETGRPRELSPGGEPSMERQYWARLDDLAHDIADLLRTLETSAGNGNSHPGSSVGPDGEPPASPSATRTAARPTGDEDAVYLADTSFDLKEQRDRLRRELLEHGHPVFPDRPLPLVAEECRQVILSQLEHCRLSIHLVGQRYGVVPEGGTVSLVELQHRLAVEHASQREDFPRLVWVPPEIDIEDERQKLFLEHLTRDPESQQEADLLSTSLEDFKLAVHRRLQPPEPERDRASGPGEAAEDPLIRIYLICDQRDLETVAPVEDLLFDQGHEVIVPVFEGDEAQVRRDHEESLVLCDAVLLYYGAGNELWLRRKLREVQKSAGLGRSAPVPVKTVLVAPPDTPRKERFRTHEAQVIHQRGELEPSTLEPFLEELARLGRTPS